VCDLLGSLAVWLTFDLFQGLHRSSFCKRFTSFNLVPIDRQFRSGTNKLGPMETQCACFLYQQLALNFDERTCHIQPIQLSGNTVDLHPSPAFSSIIIERFTYSRDSPISESPSFCDNFGGRKIGTILSVHIPLLSPM